MIKEILIAFLIQIGSTIGLVVLFGFIINLVVKLFYSNFGSKSLTVCKVTGAFGTPIHELSHALFCLIFGHKIDEVKLFTPNDDHGTLGYVKHSYNPKNIYHRIGCFFIGIAPIVIISTILYLLSLLFLPGMMASITELVRGVPTAGISNVGKIFTTIFSYMGSWQFWVYILISMLLCLHMTLSGADIKGAASGVIFVILVFLILDVIFALLGKIDLLTGWILSFSGVLITIFALSLAIGLVAVLFSFIIRIIFHRFL